MDAIEFMDEIQQVGIALADRKVKPEHFAQFIPDELGPGIPAKPGER
jgi:hypothetical protein